jgi:NADH:ubiquinone oxidoreductase subunit 2 (subunit N)
MNWMDYIVAAPEMTLLGLICVVMIADLYVEDESRATTFWLTLLSLFVTGAVLYFTAPESRYVAFYGAYVADPFSTVLKLATIGFVAVAFLYARDYLRANDLNKGEYYLLGLFGLLGMMIMMSANSLLTMYLGLETLALSMYALVAIDRKNVLAAESAMKYFVLGAIASGALLYGISWVYGVTGSLARGRSRSQQPAAMVRARIPDRRHRLQVRRRAVPHVAARRLRGRAYPGHAVPRLGAQARRAGARVPHPRGRARPAARDLEHDDHVRRRAVDPRR